MLYETTLSLSHNAIESDGDDVKCCGSTSKTKLPAYCYAIEVCAGGSNSSDAQLKAHRRYSDFVWLHHALQSNPPISAEAEVFDNEMIPMLMLPPKTFFWKKQTDEFRCERQIQLYEFLDDVLSRPGYATHPAMISFLLLNYAYDNDEGENTIMLQE